MERGAKKTGVAKALGKARHEHRTSDDILDQIILLATSYEWPATLIYKAVGMMVEAGVIVGTMPSRRTTERIVRDYRTESTQQKWSMRDVTGDEARIILTVLRAVILSTMEEKRSFTLAEAGWVLKLSKVFPDKSPLAVWQLAQMCVVQEARGASPEGLAGFIALVPLWDALAERDRPYVQLYWDEERVKEWVKGKEGLLGPHVYRTTHTLPELIRNLHDSGLSIERIAELCGVDPTFIKQLIDCMEAETPKAPKGRDKQGGQ